MAAYDEGYRNRRQGGDNPSRDCPYETLTKAWFDWVDGWKDADGAMQLMAMASALRKE